MWVKSVLLSQLLTLFWPKARHMVEPKVMSQESSFYLYEVKAKFTWPSLTSQGEVLTLCIRVREEE